MATLLEKLLAAGFDNVISATEAGAIEWQPGTGIGIRRLELFDQIVREHAHPELAPIRIRLENAKLTAKNIPNWAAWSQEEWQTYFDANLADDQVNLVTSLATARVMLSRQNLVIQNLVKMVIAMRDQLWPDLPEP